MDHLSCPYCASTSVRLLDAMFTVRLVELPEGGGFVQQKCPVYRCLKCGHDFGAMEAEEGSEPEEDSRRTIHLHPPPNCLTVGGHLTIRW